MAGDGPGPGASAGTGVLGRDAPPELALTARLVAFDTSTREGTERACEFAAGWLESAGLAVAEHRMDSKPILIADVGDGPVTILLHGHIDVVPGRREQFAPWFENGSLFGRGTYDMKGGLAGMMAAIAELADRPPDGVRVRLVVVPDEEHTEQVEKATDYLLDRGLTGDFAITGEPTDLQVGVQAKGVLAVRIEVAGRAAHGSTPWLGENAVLRALERYEQLLRLPFMSKSSALFPAPSANLGRISAGDVINRVPDRCVMDVDIRYLPGQDQEKILSELHTLEDCEITPFYRLPPADTDPADPFVEALAESMRSRTRLEVQTVGRNGASDAIHFLRHGVPAVEFGPLGGGHHGPREHVNGASLRAYRAALVDFCRVAGRFGPRRPTAARVAQAPPAPPARRPRDLDL